MTRWRRSAVWAALLVGLTLVLTTTLGALHLSRFHDSFRAQFESRAALSAQIFAESIGRASDETHLQTLTQAFVRGDVLFAQVVDNGVVIAEDRTEAVLDTDLHVMDFEGQLQRRSRTLEDGTGYYELIRPLSALNADDATGPAEPTYVRIGFSLERVRSAVQTEALVTIGVGLGLVAIVGLGTGIYLVRSRPRADRASADRDDARSATAPSPSTLEPERVSPESESHGDEAAGPTSTPESERVRVGSLQIDPRGKEVYVDDHAVELTPKEYELVHLLASEPGRVFSNREILDEVWAAENAHAPTSKDVKQYIYLLRQKLERDAGRPELIVTVRGFGYKLAPDVASSERDHEGVNHG